MHSFKKWINDLLLRKRRQDSIGSSYGTLYVIHNVIVLYEKRIGYKSLNLRLH